MATWEEVKRLAADLQKIQLSSTTQKLSERNCIEIVLWLTKQKLINLVYTSDGKECITPNELTQNIIGELYVNGGRVNMVEMAKSIGVDFAHISAACVELLKTHKTMHMILGQLIDETYLARIAGEINERLSQFGRINISDLTIFYDLPTDFLQQQVMERHLGKVIMAQQDRHDAKLFYTEAFIARTKAVMRGCLVGITRPTPVSTIIAHIGINEKLFFTLFEPNFAYGYLTSRAHGSIYMPNIYCKTQNMWATNFLKHNNYIELETLTQMGVTDHKNFLKKIAPDLELIYLPSCVVARQLIDQLEPSIDECIASKSFLDLDGGALPSMFTAADIEALLNVGIAPTKQHQYTLLGAHLLSNGFVDTLLHACEPVMGERARACVDSGQYQQHQMEAVVSVRAPHKSNVVVEEEGRGDKKGERRRKAAGGKSGGGAQGRETKTKSVKKMQKTHRGHGDDESDDEEVVAKRKNQLEIVSVDDVKKAIEHTACVENFDDFLDELSIHLQPTVNKCALTMAADLHHAAINLRTTNKRHTHNEIQSRINLMLTDIRLFVKGLKLLPADAQAQLNKYLQKTLCTDVLNELLNYVAGEEGTNLCAAALTNEQRLKCINDLPGNYKGPLLALYKTLNQTVDDFSECVETALACCSMIVKKIDKKKDRAVVVEHKRVLIEEMERCDEPALVLHLATLILFIGCTQQMVHASGRHVSAILAFLGPFLSGDQVQELTQYHDFVALMLGGGTEAENAREKLKERMETIREVAVGFKKVPAT